MSARDYKFVSPGVFIEEIDNSQRPAIAAPIGPVVIGRSRRGPAYRPVKVSSFSEFITIFGNPVAGEEASDQWRSGVPTAPTFAAYAAQAWLKNNSALTFIRLLGEQHPDADTTDNTATAGWTAQERGTSTQAAAGGGAYGLFLFNSSSTPFRAFAADADGAESVDGVLAATFYTTTGAPALVGQPRGGNASITTTYTASAALIDSLDSNLNFKLRIYDTKANLEGSLGTTGVLKEAVFNFNRSSNNFIRKVFNTNATKTNSNLIDTSNDSTSTFFLGQSYERHVAQFITASQACYGIILQMGGGTMGDGGDHKFATNAAQTGWFFSQDLRNTAGDGNNGNAATVTSNQLIPAFNPEAASSNVAQKLFKLHTLSTGDSEQRQFKISIEDIRYSRNDNTPYGTFTLAIRDIKDTDGAKRYVERYTNLTLDSNSPNYIGKQIGDMYVEWDTNKKRLVEYGSYPNVSKIVRVEVASAVESAQTNPELLPFGVYGPTKLKDFILATTAGLGGLTGSNAAPVDFLGFGSGSCFLATTGSGDTRAQLAVDSKVAAFTGSVKFPAIPLRSSSAEDNLSDPTEAYFGAQFTRATGSVIFDASNLDVLYSLPKGAGGAAGFGEVASTTETSWYFTLDDLRMDASADKPAYYASGSRENGVSITATSGSYKSVLDKGYDRFTSPLYGGFDGFNIKEKEPLNQARALPEGATETGYSMFYSVKKAIDMYADPEFIDGNILTAPGIVNEGLTTHMIQTVESRGDTLAIIDPRGGYTPASEDYQNEQSRISATHVNDVVSNMQQRNLNSSYAATYYPWVRITDTISGRGVWAPPSVAAFGALSFSEKVAAPWFAPAGFTRGGLSQGAAGIPVTMVRSKLTSKERDDLYDVNINPIASLPNEGIVIFGQKTLQATPSALDRINVRRLMIFVKKEISRIASTLLFEPNVQDTWSNFTSQVEPFLAGVQNQFGLDGFRVQLDETTTTPDLIDQNIIYAKIFLKPTKVVEFFAIDFVITNSGAGFED